MSDVLIADFFQFISQQKAGQCWRTDKFIVLNDLYLKQIRDPKPGIRHLFRIHHILKLPGQAINVSINQPINFSPIFAAMTQEQIRVMRDRVTVLGRFL